MTEATSFASLSSGLLARKGGAKPAMRSSLQPVLSTDSLARVLPDDMTADDLGWNDMGDDHGEKAPVAPTLAGVEHSAEIVPILADSPLKTRAKRPAVVQQREQAEKRIAAKGKDRRSAIADGRRAAFTLRVDEERHLMLRLACTIRNCSAQQLVTEALDRVLAELPDLNALAHQVAQKR